ncbi:MAG: endonuclease [Candidatus Sericytochromatia bacterium]
MFRRTLAISVLTLLAACQSAPLNANLRAPVRFQSANNGAQTDWFSQLPPNLQAYYAEARGLTGAPLFEALHDIISRNHTPYGYGEAKSFIYATADNFQVNNKPGVVAVYSDIFVPGSGGNGNAYKEQGDANKDGTSGDFINCEHTWPQSFFNKQMPMVSDMHHLFPTFSKPNGMRGHHPFGMASEGRVVYSTSSGSNLVMRSNRLSASTAPVDPEEGFSPFANGDAVFEPANKQKGNTARAMMYFWTRYKDSNVRSGDYNAQKFWNSRLSMFRQWSEQIDVVDERERARHEIIAKKQGNRNPFIDIPNLASLIGEQNMAAR